MHIRSIAHKTSNTAYDAECASYTQTSNTKYDTEGIVYGNKNASCIKCMLPRSDSTRLSSFAMHAIARREHAFVVSNAVAKRQHIYLFIFNAVAKRQHIYLFIFMPSRSDSTTSKAGRLYQKHAPKAKYTILSTGVVVYASASLLLYPGVNFKTKHPGTCKVRRALTSKISVYDAFRVVYLTK